MVLQGPWRQPAVKCSAVGSWGRGDKEVHIRSGEMERMGQDGERGGKQEQEGAGWVMEVQGGAGGAGRGRVG